MRLLLHTLYARLKKRIGSENASEPINGCCFTEALTAFHDLDDRLGLDDHLGFIEEVEALHE